MPIDIAAKRPSTAATGRVWQQRFDVASPILGTDFQYGEASWNGPDGSLWRVCSRRKPGVVRPRLFFVLVIAVGLGGAACANADSTSAAASGTAAGATVEPTTVEADEAAAVEVDPDNDADGDVETEGSAPQEETPPGDIETTGWVRSAVDGESLAGATVSAGEMTTTTDNDGRFTLDVPSGSSVTVARPGWIEITTPIGDPTADFFELTVDLEPFTVRGLRVSGEVAGDPERFNRLLVMADNSVVNTLVFDTKDEDDRVLYQSEVPLAQAMGAIEALYDPAELLAKADEHDLYTVTRIVTFEDRLWAESVPEAQLAADWVDATDQANWEYPLALAAEACRLGFDEVQFDYVRFPEGRAAEQARDLGRIPDTSDERAAAIGAFLAEARNQLAPDGCAVSAAIFGVVMSSPTDEGIGQTVEAVSASVDAVSPMIYPSHYGPGWIGLNDPNEHPGQVVAHALDGGIPRLAANTLMRPWLQAFEYRPDQVKAQINEVEQRGGGWILWNFYGRYNEDALPTDTLPVEEDTP